MKQRVINKLSKERNIKGHNWSTTHRVLKSPKSKMCKLNMQCVTVYHVPKCMSCHKAIVVITGREHIVFKIAYMLCLSCFCEIWALCVSWITYDHLYYAHCLACWALLGSLVPAMCNRTSCAQVHELTQSHCSDKREDTLFSWLHIYYAHLAFASSEHSVCRGSVNTTYITLIA